MRLLLLYQFSKIGFLMAPEGGQAAKKQRKPPCAGARKQFRCYSSASARARGEKAEYRSYFISAAVKCQEKRRRRERPKAQRQSKTAAAENRAAAAASPSCRRGGDRSPLGFRRGTSHRQGKKRTAQRRLWVKFHTAKTWSPMRATTGRL